MNMEGKEIERDEELPDDTIGSGLGRKKQPWMKQLTLRGVIVSIVIGAIYSIIAMKLNLTTGLVPNLNVSAALLAFVLIRAWTQILHKGGYVVKPFTRQENTMIQTCAVACYSISVGGLTLTHEKRKQKKTFLHFMRSLRLFFAGGFASYLLGLNKKTYELAGIDSVGNSREAVKEPAVGWMTGYLFVVCFVGLFVLIPLRKVSYKLSLLCPNSSEFG